MLFMDGESHLSLWYARNVEIAVVDGVEVFGKRYRCHKATG